MARARKKPIPITIVAGARGTGKTTLINRLLKTPAFAGTAVVLNDFGKTALDGVSLAAIGDSYLSLGGGCICCAARGALSETLEGLLRDLDNGRVDPVSRVVVETDAAADPAAILGEVALHPYLSLRFVADGIVAVLAAPAVGDMLAGQANVVRQIAMADVVAVFGGALPALAAVNPRAAIVDAATVDASALMGHGPFDPASGDIAAWLGPDTPPAATPLMGEAGRIHTFTVARQHSVSLAAADRFIEYLAYLQASNLIRLRGAVATPDGDTVILEGIGNFFLPPAIVDGSAATATTTRFAVTARDLDAATFSGILDAFLNEASVDTPDRTALTDNPLAIPGFSARQGR